MSEHNMGEHHTAKHDTSKHGADRSAGPGWLARLAAVLVIGSLPAAAQASPTFADGVVVGVVTEPAINEASGLVASRANAGVLWTHNDSVIRLGCLPSARRATISGVLCWRGP